MDAQLQPTIPVVDLSGFMAGDVRAQAQAAAELRAALEHVGFFFVTGHGVDWKIVEETYAAAGRFFDLPAAEKEKIAIGGGEMLMSQRGYIPLGGGATRYEVDDSKTRQGAVVESLFLDYEARGRNQWPADLPGFREQVLRYLEAIDGLAKGLLPLYALALDMPPDHFAPYFTAPTVGLRLSHYPPFTEANPEGWGLSAHTDRSFMTLLPTNDVPGLCIRPPRSEWIETPNIAESFLVNAGDALRRWSNNRFRSTLHRVSVPSRDRYALPYFFGPGEDAILEALPTCVNAEHPAKYPPISFGEFDRQFLRGDG